jgi:pyruvate carboxylase
LIKVQYFSLGTFEFLVNPSTGEYYFLEVNPRLQVEHTITESISHTDIVKAQLLLAQGADLQSCGLPTAERDPAIPPPAHSIQLRITAENVQGDWSLSIGKITAFQFPTGNGIRVDTHLVSGHSAVVSADFDSLIAKVIVTASSWEDTVRKAQRALRDTHIAGVKTNIDMLIAIVAHQDFLLGKCDTQWLESKHEELLESSRHIVSAGKNTLSQQFEATTSRQSFSATNTLFRKGDAWSIALSAPGVQGSKSESSPRHLELTRVLRNEFPASLSAEILFTAPSTTSSQSRSTPYTLTLTSTSSSASAATSRHRRGNPSDPSHINIPFPGKLVEVLIDEGDIVKEGEVICVVQQMKMELEVRTPKSGRVTFVTEAEDGEEVAEGMLAAIVESERGTRL